MNTWKKLLTIAILIFSSIFACVACSCTEQDLYANMKIELVAARRFNGEKIDNNTIFLSSNTDENVFTLEYSVNGVSGDVSKNLKFYVDNPSIVVFNEGSYNGNITYGKFTAISDGETIIRAVTLEGNKFAEFRIKVEVPITSFVVKNNMVPIVRGTTVDLSTSDAYIEYEPYNTTQRKLQYKVGFLNENDENNPDNPTVSEIMQADLDKIQDQLNNDSTLITIPEDSLIKSFLLHITSVENQNLTQTAVVNVLDKPTIKNISIEEVVDANLPEEEIYRLLEHNDILGKYTLSLAANNGDYFEYTNSTLLVNYVTNDGINFGSIANKKIQYYSYVNGEPTLGEEQPEYSITIKGLQEDGTILGQDLVTATKVNDDQFKINKTFKQGTSTIYVVIDYYGFENRFEALEIPIDIKLQMFPSEIKLFASEKDMVSSDKNNTKGLELKDNDLVIYNNGARTPVWISVWSDSKRLSGQTVKLEVNNDNVQITDINGQAIEVIEGNQVVYLSKKDSTMDITSDIELKVTSTVYKNIEKIIKVSCVNEDTIISTINNKLALEVSKYNSDPTTINDEYGFSIIEGRNNQQTQVTLRFEGLPKNEAGEPDYTSLTVEVADKSYFDVFIDIDNNDIIFRNIRNKIGSTTVTITTPNGIVHIFDVYVFYPIGEGNESFLQLQIEGFEDFNGADEDTLEEYKDSVYHFVGRGVHDQENKAETKLLVGETYSFYYILSADSNNHRFNDLEGMMTTARLESSNSDIVEVSGRLIKVKQSSTAPVQLRFEYVTLATDVHIFFEINVTFETPIESVTTDELSISIYDSTTLPKGDIYIGDTLTTYQEQYAKKNIELQLAPNNPTVTHTINWFAAEYSSTGTGLNYSPLDKSKFPDKTNLLNAFAIPGENDNELKGTIYLTTFANEKEQDPRNIILSVEGSNGLSNSFKFKLYATVNQSYYTSSGEIVTDTLYTEILVTVIKASKVGGISTEIYNNQISFDIRNMDVKNGVFVSNNTYEFNYSLSPLISAKGEVLGEGILIDEIVYDLPNADISIQRVGDNRLKLIVHQRSGKYLDLPKYTIVIRSKAYNASTTITVKINDGRKLPFEIDTAQELMDIGNSTYSAALSSNYVLTKNIDLRGINWQAIGNKEHPFTGSLSGRYYINDFNYRDFAILNLAINIDHSGHKLIETTEYSNTVGYYGLFGCLGENAKVENLKVYNYSINIRSYDQSEISTNPNVTDYIGVIAAVNKGSIINSIVDDATINRFNGATIVNNANTTAGIKYNSGENESIINYAYIGSIAGMNTGSIHNSRAIGNIFTTSTSEDTKKFLCVGGFVGLNIGTIDSDKENFVVSDGLEEFDSAIIINANRKSALISTTAMFGGVAGANTGTIDNLAVRAFIFADTLTAGSSVYGTGGVVGYNRGIVSNNTVVPNIIGSGNVGGLIGSMNYAKRFEGDILNDGEFKVFANKVQFLDFKDAYMFMRTGIFGRDNVGGLIGYYNNVAENIVSFKDDNGKKKPKSITNNNGIIEYNSVASYYSRNVIAERYSYTDTEPSSSANYYGDIVIGDIESSDDRFIGGLVGKAINLFINSGYANAKIAINQEGTTYVGGVIGSAENITNIFNVQALGTVYNISTTSSQDHIGGFFGSVVNLNQYDTEEMDNLLPYDVNYTKDTGDSGDGACHIYLPDSNDGTQGSYNDLKTLIINTLPEFESNDFTLAQFANIVSSYSAFVLKESNGSDYAVSKSAGQEKTITNPYGNSLVWFKYDGQLYSAKSITIPRVLSYNSFNFGEKITLNLAVTTGSTTTCHKLSDSDSITFNLNDEDPLLPMKQLFVPYSDQKDLFEFNVVIDGKDTTYKYYKSIYNLEYSENGYTTKTFYSAPLQFIAKGCLPGVSTDSREGIPPVTFETAMYGDFGSESIKGKKSLYVCDPSSETGLNFTIDQSGNNIYDDKSKLVEYYRYFNSSIHSSLPISFGYEKTYYQNGKNYINLIINLAPTLIYVDNNNLAGVDYSSVWIGTTQDSHNLDLGTKTLSYYEFDYADKVSNAYKYSQMPWNEMQVDGEIIKVIDINNDGIFSQLDIEYSKYANSELSKKNLYRLKDVLKMTIVPPFLQNGMMSFVSSNSKIADIEIIDYEPYIRVKSSGSVEFTITSVYNTNVKTSFSVNIINAVTDMGVYSDLGCSTPITDTLNIVKNEKLSTVLYTSVFGYLQGKDLYSPSLQAYSKINFALHSDDTYGIRYFFMDSYDKLTYKIHDDEKIFPVKINGKSFTDYIMIGGEYAYYIDDYSMAAKVSGVNNIGECTLLAVPFVEFASGERTYLVDFEDLDLNNTIAKRINLRVVQGTYNIRVPESELIAKPLNEQDLTVWIDTDNENSELFLNIYKNDSTKYLPIYDDQGNELDHANDSIFGLDVKAYKINDRDSKGNQIYPTYYFDTMYLRLVSVEEIKQGTELKSKKYNFVIGIVEDYLFNDDLVSDYQFQFKVVKYTQEELKADANVTIERQEINDVIAKHYSGVKEYAENVTEYQLTEFYESNTLVTGYPGLLQIDLFPKYASLDYIEIESSVVDGHHISLEHLVAMYKFNDKNIEHFDGYYKAYIDEREVIAGGRGIKVGKVSYQNNGKNYYDGTFYARTVIPDISVGSREFTITIRCYYAGNLVGTESVNITVTKLPNIDISINGDDTGILPLGTSLDIDVNTDAEITWKIVGADNALTDEAPRYNSATGKYTIGCQSIAESYWDTYVGKTFTITATVKVDVKGRIYSTSDTISIRLALFTIDEISVEHVENGYFTGIYKQPYELIAYISKFTCDPIYRAKIQEEYIDKLSKEMSLAKTKAFQIEANGAWNDLNDEPNQKADFWIEKNKEKYTIKNNMRFTSSNLKARVNILYSDNFNKKDSTGGVIINPVSYDAEDALYMRERERKFGLHFIRLSNEESPEPIYTQLELENMEAGGHYILLNDIVLKDWTPINTEIASLDGNGYIITINKDSLYDTKIKDTSDSENSQQEKLDLGIFSSISSSTVIKNLIIEVMPSSDVLSDTLATTNNDININVENYSQVRFGLLAAENSGMVTNVNVTHNADAYRLERVKLLNAKDSNLINYDSAFKYLVNKYSTIDNSWTPKNSIDSIKHTFVKDSTTYNRYLSTINLDYGNITTNTTTNRIAGLVAVNNGYITNSNVNNITIKGLDCVAGFVAENNNIISSSYYYGGNVNAQVSSTSSDTLGAAGFVFYNTGRIAYSYSEGHRKLTQSTLGLETKNFTGNYTQGEDKLRTKNTGVVSEGGNTSSFVYNNSGSIIDSYTNLLSYGSTSTGFVFTNSGTINNVYTLSSVLQSDANHNPFISLINKYTESNNTGTITNAYYLKMVEADFDPELDKNNSKPLDNYLNESKQIATPLSASRFFDYNTFETFAFNSNYDSISDIIYNEDTDEEKIITQIEEISRSVWFFQRDNIDNLNNYFQKDSYTIGAPQLVSANLKTYSFKTYESDNLAKIISDIYEPLCQNFVGLKNTLSKNDILAKVTKEDNAQNLIINVYLDNSIYNNGELKADIENTIKNKIAEEYKNTYDVTVSFASKQANPVPEGSSTYDYCMITKNSGGVSIEYGDSILNPYLIKSARDYNVFIMQTDENNNNAIEDVANFRSNKFLRLISDITFSSQEMTVKTFNVAYSGVLDGNGMTISDIRINADTTKSSNAINKQQEGNYIENEKYISAHLDIVNNKFTFENIEYTVSSQGEGYVLQNNGDIIDTKKLDYVINAENNIPKTIDIYRKATSVGMFAKLIDGACVKNVNIEIAELYGTGVNFVGTVAGQVINSKIYNVTVDGSNVVIFGHNVVGGVVGRIEGDSLIVNATSNVSVTATYINSYNTFNKDNISINTNSSYNIYETKTDTESSNFYQISYAGGIAGIVDITPKTVDSFLDIQSICTIRCNTVMENSKIRGEIVGGLYGYLGKNTNTTVGKFIVSSDSNLDASRIAGGIAGINYGGSIDRSYVSYIKSEQDVIDNNISLLQSVDDQIYGDKIFGNDDKSVFIGNPHYIGGIVGINNAGTISNTYNKVNVVNINSMYAGGIAGVSFGGDLRVIYTTADVYAFYGVGGIIGLSLGYLDMDDVDLNKLYINNHQYLSQAGSITNLTMQGIVAINMWKFEHINDRRVHINPIAKSAFVGSIIGEMKDNATVYADELIDRMSNENNFVINTYTYRSINNYRESLTQDQFTGFELLSEIGNKNEVFNIDSTSRNADGNIVLDANTNIYNIVDNYQLTFKCKHCGELLGAPSGTNFICTECGKSANEVYMHSGNIVLLDDDEDSGEYIKISSSHYSRLRKYSSVRTLHEIIARKAIDDEATTTLKLMGADSDSLTNDQVDTMNAIVSREGIAKPLIEITNEKTKDQRVYAQYVWKEIIWSGIGFNEDSIEKIDPEIIFPVHASKLSNPVIEVKKYQDLKQVNEYPGGTFILMNDITVPADAKPLTSLGNPFTGTLKSKDGENYTIIFEGGMTSQASAGLFAAIKGATLKNFNVVVNGDIIMSHSKNQDSAGGALFGYAVPRGYVPNVIENVDITYAYGAKVTVQKDETAQEESFAVAYVGSVGGKAENILIRNVNVVDPQISLKGTTNSALNRDIYIGGLFGYASVLSVKETKDDDYTLDKNPFMSGNITLTNPTLDIDLTFEKSENYDSYKNLGIGGLFGKIVNTTSYSAELMHGSAFVMTNLKAENLIANVKLNAYKANGSNVTDFVSFESAAVGGLFGMAEGIDILADDSIIDKFTIRGLENINASNLVVENNGVYASSYDSRKGNFSVGGIIGELGGNGNGNINIEDVNNSIQKVQYKHNNTQTYLSEKYSNINSDVNISAIVGSVISSKADLYNLLSETLIEYQLSEADNTDINIGGIVGKHNGGVAEKLVNSKTIQAIQTNNNSTPIILGEKTVLNIGGVIGKYTGGEIIQSGSIGNIVAYLAENSHHNVNIGGLIGLSDVSNENSETSRIDQSFASGDVNLYVYDDEFDSVGEINLGGFIGMVINNADINNSYSSSKVETFTYTINDGNNKINYTNVSTYHSIGGMIGIVKIQGNQSYKFNVVDSYTIANLVININEDPLSYIGGFIARAEEYSVKFDISSSIDIPDAYYLADFMLDTNSMGTALGVDELLFNNFQFNNNDFSEAKINNKDYWTNSIWATNENQYPVLVWSLEDEDKFENLIDERLLPVDYTDVNNVVTAGKSYIVTANSFTLNKSTSSNDIYFKGVELSSCKFTTVDRNSRIYGMKLTNVSSPVIEINDGKVSTTKINTLNSSSGYITTNNGIDIHPVITSCTSLVYGVNKGLVAYADISGSSSSITTTDPDLPGYIKLSKFTSTNSTFEELGCEIYDSYVTLSGGLQYYNNQGAASDVMSDAQAKDIGNFSENYDFVNNWIILPISDEMSDTELKARHNGQVFLCWELKETINKKWYFEDIDLYSPTQTEYAEYVWSNALNADMNAKNKDLTSYVEFDNNKIKIQDALGLIAYSRLINTSRDYVDKDVELSADIDLFGKLFTPISGADILGMGQNNIFSGSFNGANKSINNMYVITEKNAGLFGIAKVEQINDLTVANSTLITNDYCMGTVVATQQGIYPLTLSNVIVENSYMLHSRIGESEAIVGTLVGMSDTQLNIENCQVKSTNNGGAIHNGDIVGGFVGRSKGLHIKGSHNEQKIIAKNIAGGLVGLVVISDTAQSLDIYQSYNLGDVYQTFVPSNPSEDESKLYAAGGLVGKISANDSSSRYSINQCFNTSLVQGYNAAGLIGMSTVSFTHNEVADQDESIRYSYVSRGDVGAVVGGDTNDRDNINNVVIIGNGGITSALVNMASDTAVVDFRNVYSSLEDLQLTNSTKATYHRSYMFDSSETPTNDTSMLNNINHAMLSEPTNNIFDDWSLIWTRVSQKNNNYPVHIFSSELWDTGKGLEEDENGQYVITCVEDLAWVSKQVHIGNSFEDKTIVFKIPGTNVLDMKGKLWNPIGYDEKHSFKGNMIFNNIDGEDNIIIQNMTTNGYYTELDGKPENWKTSYVGLFGYTNGATFSGKLTLRTDEATKTEGSHINCFGSYAGAFIGYAYDTTFANDFTVINHLDVHSENNVEGGNYVGGIIGCYELPNNEIQSYAIRGTESGNPVVNFGTMINHGNVFGNSSNSTQYMAGVIGVVQLNGKAVDIKATELTNQGDVSSKARISSGVISAILGGENSNLHIVTISSSSDINNESKYFGGLIGYTEGTAHFESAILKNETNAAVTLTNRSSMSNAGAIIGYAKSLKIADIQMDTNGGIIFNKYYNKSESQIVDETFAIGGVVGQTTTLEIGLITPLETGENNTTTISNIAFNLSYKDPDDQEYTNYEQHNKYVGGVVGKVDTLIINKDSYNKDWLVVHDIKGIEGTKYLGGIAGYVGKLDSRNIADSQMIQIYEINIEEKSNLFDLSEDKLNEFGFVGGAYGYVHQVEGNVVVDEEKNEKCSKLGNYSIKSSRITGTSRFIGGFAGQINTVNMLANITVSQSVINGRTDWIDTATTKFKAESKHVGGVVGSLGNATADKKIDISDLKITSSDTDQSTVSGAQFVGGLFGSLYQADVSAVVVNAKSITASADNVGGVIGQAKYVDLYDIKVAHNNMSISGTGYVGGVIGHATQVNMTYIEVNIDMFTGGAADYKENDADPSISYYNGGVVGYITTIDNTPESSTVLENINVTINQSESIISTSAGFGGIAGYAKNVSMYEVSSDLVANKSNVYGIVHTIDHLNEGINWYSNNYWLFNNGSFVVDEITNAYGQKTKTIRLYMAYAQGATLDEDSVDGNHGAIIEDENSVIGNKLYLSNTVVYTPTEDAGKHYVLVNDNLHDENNYQQTDQIFLEAGLWTITSDHNNTSGSLSFTKDMTLRSVSESREIEVNGQDYRTIYAGLTKRYRPNTNAEDVTITIKSDIENTGNTGTVDEIVPLGSHFFPINNLTIDGDGHKMKLGSSSTFVQGSSSEYVDGNKVLKYDLFGIIGKINNSLAINNLEICGISDNPTINVTPKFNHTKDSMFGLVAAKLSPMGESTIDELGNNILSSIKTTIGNITISDPNITVAGGVIGNISVYHTSPVITSINNNINKITSEHNTILGGFVGTISSTENEGSVVLNGITNNIVDAGSSTQSVYSGGMVGRVHNIFGLQFEKCINSGVITNSSDAEGGFIGHVSNNQFHFHTSDSEFGADSIGNITFVQCVNNAEQIGSENDYYVGGLIGYVNDVSITLDSNRNYGSIISSTQSKVLLLPEGGTHTTTILGTSGGLIGVVRGGGTFTTTTTTGYEDDGINTIKSNAKIKGYYAGSVVGQFLNHERAPMFDFKGHISTSTEDNTLENDNCLETLDIKICATISGGVVGRLWTASSNISVKNLIFANIQSSVITDSGSIADSDVIDGDSKAGIIAEVYRAETLTFNNCHFSGSLLEGFGKNYAGGLIGFTDNLGIISRANNIIINNCSSAGEIYADQVAGGLVGLTKANVLINNSHNEATIESSVAGGLIGQTNGETTITNAVNNGAITSTSVAGGLIGQSNGKTTITKAINNGTVTSAIIAGGIVGYSTSELTIGDMYNVNSIKNSGEIRSTATSYQGNDELKPVAGGIVGRVDNTTDIKNATNNAAVTACLYAGGIIGISSNGNYEVTIMYNILNSGTIVSNGISPSSAGGIIGYSGSNEISIGNGMKTTTDVLNCGDVISNGQCAGGIIGQLASLFYISNVSVESAPGDTCTIQSATYAAGIIAQITCNIPSLPSQTNNYVNSAIVQNITIIALSGAVGNRPGIIIGVVYDTDQLSINNSQIFLKDMIIYHGRNVDTGELNPYTIRCDQEGERKKAIIAYMNDNDTSVEYDDNYIYDTDGKEHLIDNTEWW